MHSKSLLIVFVKKPVLGEVKTRLAKTVGDQNALTIYKELLNITESETLNLENCDLEIHFSNGISDEWWENEVKKLQNGANLGKKMLNAFDNGFKNGYEKILLIGSDLPKISAPLLKEGFAALDQNNLVFGPAKDGGYYLIGMNKLYKNVFQNKPWSRENLLTVTLNELKNETVCLLQELNDIDDYEDLMENPSLIKLIDQQKLA